MNELKVIYKVIHDDLKDSDMLVEYAKELKNTNKSLADMFMADAKTRLSHSQIMHKEFTGIVEKIREKDGNEEVANCLWEVTHNYYMEWYDKLENCIKKW